MWDKPPQQTRAGVMPSAHVGQSWHQQQRPVTTLVKHAAAATHPTTTTTTRFPGTITPTCCRCRMSPHAVVFATACGVGHGQDHQTAVFGAARFMSSLWSVRGSQACGRATSRWAPLSRNTTMLQRHAHRQAAVPRPGPSSAAASWPAATLFATLQPAHGARQLRDRNAPRRAHARTKDCNVVGADGSGAGYAVSSPLVSASKVV